MAFLKSAILIILVIMINNNQYNNYIKNDNNWNALMYIKDISLSQSSFNETNAPIIIFIQPALNNTIIDQSSYSFLVNITDENPPLFGNVTLLITNSTEAFFNVSMSYNGDSLWSFNWNNISSYPNQFYSEYLIQVRAIDNSSHHNLGFSEIYYIYLNLPGQSPGIINVIIYLIVVCVIIAGIVVYLNKKLLAKPTDKNVMEI
ncbi:MAG: hypothetical protein ACFFEY_00410 [Candidatus Thorarchaeota archaeon]